MKLTASSLRQNIYKILDEAIETGVPVEIVRKGQIVKIIPPEKKDKLKNLKKRKVMTKDPQYYVHLDWSKEWKI